MQIIMHQKREKFSWLRTIALEFAPWLRVNVICLGCVLTPAQESKYTSEMIKEINSAISLIRHAKP